MLCCRCGHSSLLPVYGASLTGSADGCQGKRCLWPYWTSEGSSLPHIGHIGICVSLDSMLSVSSTSMVRGSELATTVPDLHLLDSSKVVVRGDFFFLCNSKKKSDRRHCHVSLVVRISHGLNSLLRNASHVVFLSNESLNSIELVSALYRATACGHARHWVTGRFAWYVVSVGPRQRAAGRPGLSP